MAKTDLVATYYDGEPTHSTKPRFYTRAECRAMKHTGQGLFGDHGKVFIIYRPVPGQQEVIADVIDRIVMPRVTANSRTQGLIAPERLHYPVPALGAHTRVVSCHRINHGRQWEEQRSQWDASSD